MPPVLTPRKANTLLRARSHPLFCVILSADGRSLAVRGEGQLSSIPEQIRLFRRDHAHGILDGNPLKLILAPADETLDATCVDDEGESVANPGSKLDMTRRDFVKTVSIGIGALQTAAAGAGIIGLTGCGGSPVDPPVPKVVSWPIAKQVYTTAQQQVCPVALSSAVRQLHPGDVALYSQYKYSAWTLGGPLQHIVRKDLAPNYAGAPNTTRLLYFFSISDIHIADKESPAQPIYIGWSAPYGPASSGQSSAYSPILMSTPQVLDAAIKTINAMHQSLPFDFGMSLGDACNNTQYNELRWFLDTIDGKVITPSSGGHLGASTIDYQSLSRPPTDP